MTQKIKFVPMKKNSASFAPPPVPAQSQVPQWYKDQPSYITGKKAELMHTPRGGVFPSTVKKCQAIADTLTSGYYLLAPTDIYLETEGDKIKWRIPPIQAEIVGVHSREQISHMTYDLEKYMPDIFRINPHWAIKTPKGYSTLFINPMNQETPLEAVPGIIDTDGYGSIGLFSFFVKRGFNGVIKQGTPIIQAIPFRREDWKFEIDTDYEQLTKDTMAIRSVFERGYKTKFWQRKSFN